MRAAIVCVAALVPLAGCMNMSGLSGGSKYACEAPEGVACDSVSGTYANALHSNLPSQRAAAPTGDKQPSASKPAAATSASAPAPSRRPIPTAPFDAAGIGAAGPSDLALRSRARVLRLWTKPWEDADGDLWDQGYVYVQVDAGRWQIDHVRQRIRDQYAPLRPPPAPSAPAGAGAPPPTGAAPAEADASGPGIGSVQRPTSFNPIPPLALPPAGLGARPQ